MLRKTLVRFWEGLECNSGMDAMLWHRRVTWQCLPAVREPSRLDAEAGSSPE